jgi:Zn-finger nucleic acid-binding protein
MSQCPNCSSTRIVPGKLRPAEPVEQRGDVGEVLMTGRVDCAPICFTVASTAMPNCPDCGSELRTMKHEGGLFFLCDQCGGRAATIPQVRREVGERYVTLLLHEIDRAAMVTSRKCPFCTLPMREFRNLETALVLDTCKGCRVVWFDAHEFEAASEIARKSAKRCDRPRSAGGRGWLSGQVLMTR